MIEAEANRMKIAVILLLLLCAGVLWRFPCTVNRLGVPGENGGSPPG